MVDGTFGATLRRQVTSAAPSVTAGELAELGRGVRELVDQYLERALKPELRPAGARLVSYLNIAFPNDIRPPER